MRARGIRRNRVSLDHHNLRKRAMRMHIGCSCHPGLSRRAFMCGGIAAASAAGAAPQVFAQASLGTATDSAAAAAQAKTRPVDIHAHYYPQAYFDVFNGEAQRFNAEFRVTEQGF